MEEEIKIEKKEKEEKQPSFWELLSRLIEEKEEARKPKLLEIIQ